MEVPGRGEGGGDEPRRKKVVYFHDSRPPDHVYEQQNNFKIEEISRTPSNDGFFTEPESGVSSVSSALSELGRDLIQLQARVADLERRMIAESELPGIIDDLKSQVENLRNKLESVELRSKRAEASADYRRASDQRLREVKQRYAEIWDQEIPENVQSSLQEPSFDTSLYSDAEMLLFLQHMFQRLRLLEPFDIPLPVLRKFLYEVYKNYNDVPFHNFRHCFCVAQMMYVIAWHVDLSMKMGPLDLIILLVSCICHDLDHPGYNNIYQINARTELALRYNDISPLENHHCSVAFRILRNTPANIFNTVDKDTFKEVREGIIRCILATDMARHNEILSQFKEVTNDFDFANRTHKNLLSMILIKVADISNEARPLPVAEPWLDRLLSEFFQQSDLEKLEGLPVTPFMDREKITKPSSQCSFIGFVLLPLFEALGELLPALQDIIIEPARFALEHYRKLNEAAKDERLRRKSVVENGDDLDDSQMVKSSSGLSVSRRSNASIQSRQRSKSSEECSAECSPPMSPGLASGPASMSLECEDIEEETATEVEVAEKTVKFKISTEGATPGRVTCPNSRKGSRERCQLERDWKDWRDWPEDGRRKSLAVPDVAAVNIKNDLQRRKSLCQPLCRPPSAEAVANVCQELRRLSIEQCAADIAALADLNRRKSPPDCVGARRKSAITLEKEERSESSEAEKPSLLTKLRSLKSHLPWLDKDEEESPQRSRTLPKLRKSGSRRRGRGWRAWLGKSDQQSSSLDALPH